MILQVYADESGTNDVDGQEPGSSVPILCGFIHTPEYWKGFCRKWKKILNDYKAPYFHFREFASKRLYSQIDSPYYGWSEKKRDGFLYDLAFLASDSAIPTGGFFSAKRNYELKLGKNPFETTIVKFFEGLLIELDIHFPNYNGKVFLVFDRCEDDKWLIPIHSVHASFAAKDKRVGGLTFEDDKDPIHLPLQAADLYSYVSRQLAEKVYEQKEIQPFRLLDFILNRNMIPKIRALSPKAWERTVRLMREDQKRQKALWSSQGNPKKQYYPEEHFPFEKYAREIHPQD